MKITAAELKVKLNGLGLTPGWLAERLGVTMRTVVRWMDGETIADGVAEEIDKLSEYTLASMVKMLAKVDDSADEVTLRTYRTDNEFTAAAGRTMPASWHRAMVFRVLEHLEAQGKTVHVEYR